MAPVPRPQKRLKCAEPDLLVVVGCDANKKKFEYHSLIMAGHSGYIDTLLASSMKESETRVISFPDIEPDVWQKMIGFIEDPLRAGDTMTSDDAMKLYPLYDKYDFQSGVAICSRVLEIHVRESPDYKNGKAYEEDGYYLTRLIEIFLLADRFVMKDLYLWCVTWFQSFLGISSTALNFSVEQLQMIAPMVAKEKCLLEAVFAKSKEEVLSPKWPQYFISQNLLVFYKRGFSYGQIEMIVNGVFGDDFQDRI